MVRLVEMKTEEDVVIRGGSGAGSLGGAQQLTGGGG